MQSNAKQSKAKQGNAMQSNAKQSKAKQSIAKQCKTKPSKAPQIPKIREPQNPQNVIRKIFWKMSCESSVIMRVYAS
jgi:hypothetical protein